MTTGGMGYAILLGMNAKQKQREAECYAEDMGRAAEGLERQGVLDEPRKEKAAMTDTKTEHTPGPWEAITVIGSRDGSHQVRRNGDAEAGRSAEGIAVVHGTSLSAGRTIEMVWANARLIAAAPDLLAACEALVREISVDTMAQARAAIRKAKP